jgi:hypothetical protein
LWVIGPFRPDICGIIVITVPYLLIQSPKILFSSPVLPRRNARGRIDKPRPVKMGKSKPRARDRARNRDNPASKPVKPPSDPELAAIREQRILPILKDLQSAELKTRSAAASAIFNIIEDTKCRKLLLREQIVRILFEQTLTDTNLETRTAGWGILRNLALEEEADFCIHLYRQDVLTAIEGVVKTVRAS